ncbi:mCG1031072, isoform CRA_b, partial [Mus musculus]
FTSHFSHFSLLFPFSLSSSFLSSLPLSLSFSLAFPPLFLPSLSPCISIIKLLNHRESLLHQDPLRTLQNDGYSIHARQNQLKNASHRDLQEISKFPETGTCCHSST